MSIIASPELMQRCIEHIPESVLAGMLKDGFLIPENKEMTKNDD